jgi:hypothetical protein
MICFIELSNPDSLADWVALYSSAGILWAILKGWGWLRS